MGDAHELHPLQHVTTHRATSPDSDQDEEAGVDMPLMRNSSFDSTRLSPPPKPPPRPLVLPPWLAPRYMAASAAATVLLVLAALLVGDKHHEPRQTVHELADER